MNDRVINVPIEDDDIIKTVTSLPRTEKNNGMITVGLKRDLSLKNFHKLQMIRPEKVYEALLYLIDHHPSYKNIVIPSLEQWLKEFSMKDEDETDDASDLEFENESSQEEDKRDSDKFDSEVSEENVFTSTTCLLPENPLTDVVGKLISKRFF